MNPTQRKKAAHELRAICTIAERAINRRKDSGELYGSFEDILDELLLKAKEISTYVLTDSDL
jgi:recombinational DNA repair protein (RecF pathway)